MGSCAVNYRPWTTIKAVIPRCRLGVLVPYAEHGWQLMTRATDGSLETRNHSEKWAIEAGARGSGAMLQGVQSSRGLYTTLNKGQRGLHW